MKRYDLNIAWSPSTTQDQLLQTLTLASTLGYGTVALNHTLSPGQTGNPTSPLPKRIAGPDGGAPKLPAVLHRATLPLADPAASTYRLPALSKVYDVLAVRPTEERAFSNACLTLDVPLISLDLTQRFAFHFRPKPCMAAVGRGVRFEVCYAQCLAADARGRATFIGNVRELIRATGGRGIVLSSGAADAMGLRAPADVVNLMSVWGLAGDKGVEGLSAVPRSVVVNEGIRRTGFRGVIDVVGVGEEGATPTITTAAASEGKDDGSAGGKEKNAKRKNGDADENNAHGGKNKSKKMKVVSREGR